MIYVARTKFVIPHDTSNVIYGMSVTPHRFGPGKAEEHEYLALSKVIEHDYRVGRIKKASYNRVSHFLHPKR